MASRKLRNAPPEQEGAARLKTLLGIAKRMVKEVDAYEKEVVTNTDKVQKMRDEDKDEYDIRKFEEVLQESLMMIPDSKGRLETALGNLSSCVDACKEAEEGVDAAALTEAQELLATHEI